MKRRPARNLEEANRRLREQELVIEQLSAQVSKLQRYLFGQSSERLPISIPGEDLFTEEAPEEKEEKPAPEEKRGEKEKPAQRSRQRRPLPDHLPRRTVEHDVPEADKCCAGCGCEKARIGEEVTEQLEYVPASLHVIRHVRARYACRKCQGQVVEAKRPMQPIEKGLCGPALLAQIAVAKYAEHQPLNRQEAFFRRHGVELSRSTMCTWMMEAAGLLRPLYRLLRKRVIAGRVTHSDDTGLPVLEKGKTHRAFLWTYVGDDQAPYTVYDFTWGRGREGPKAFLSGYEGYLQADAYAGYHAVYGTGRVQEVGCWAHARRKFFEARETDCVRADEALSRIGKLYGIERRAKEMAPEKRRELRQTESVELLKECNRSRTATSAEVAYIVAVWAAFQRSGSISSSRVMGSPGRCVKTSRKYANTSAPERLALSIRL